jgi:quinolinate synthase
VLWQPSLHERYSRADSAELARDITTRRQELGDSLVILGHHYQTDAVIRHADLIGDSLKLSQQAAEVVRRQPVKHIIFCGVHFMAETADMLTPETVTVTLPDLSAGCSMADMAQLDDCEAAWESMHASLRERGERARIVPVTYVNSSAAIKAFVGTHGGSCCTSSNADLVFAWAARGGDTPPESGESVKILFLPDQHLGRNTAHAFGVDVARRAPLFDPRLTRRGDPLGGMTAEQLAEARVILWAGHCSVHKLFRPEHVEEIRALPTDGGEPWRVIVHPECAKEVVDKADLAGSTEFILRTIERAEPGTRWAVGTEHNLVNRLRQHAAGRGVQVRILSDCQCLCTTMYRIDEPHLLWSLDQLCGLSPSGQRREPSVPNEVRVPAVVREGALLALERMLRLSRTPTVD